MRKESMRARELVLAAIGGSPYVDGKIRPGVRALTDWIAEIEGGLVEEMAKNDALRAKLAARISDTPDAKDEELIKCFPMTPPTQGWMEAQLEDPEFRRLYEQEQVADARAVALEDAARIAELEAALREVRDAAERGRRTHSEAVSACVTIKRLADDALADEALADDGDDQCLNGNHPSTDGRCDVDGGRKP